jgi:hypothetical protein
MKINFFAIRNCVRATVRLNNRWFSREVIEIYREEIRRSSEGVSYLIKSELRD